MHILVYNKDVFNESNVELLKLLEELIYHEACKFTLIGSKLPTNAAFSIKCEKSNMFLCASPVVTSSFTFITCLTSVKLVFASFSLVYSHTHFWVIWLIDTQHDDCFSAQLI